MNIDYLTTAMTIVNLLLLLAIIFAIYIGLKSLRNFLKRHKEMKLKIDAILNKLESK